jgi:hypothetical protein
MSLLTRIRLILDKLESYAVTYSPFRAILYDTIVVKTKLMTFKRLTRTITHFAG